MTSEQHFSEENNNNKTKQNKNKNKQKKKTKTKTKQNKTKQKKTTKKQQKPKTTTTNKTKTKTKNKKQQQNKTKKKNLPVGRGTRSKIYIQEYREDGATHAIPRKFICGPPAMLEGPLFICNALCMFVQIHVCMWDILNIKGKPLLL